MVPYHSLANTKPPTKASATLSSVPIRKYSANFAFNSGNLATDFPVRINPTREGDCTKIAVTTRNRSSQPIYSQHSQLLLWSRRMFQFPLTDCESNNESDIHHRTPRRRRPLLLRELSLRLPVTTRTVIADWTIPAGSGTTPIRESYKCVVLDRQQKLMRNLPLALYASVLAFLGQLPDASLCRVGQEPKTTRRPTCERRRRRRRTV